MTTLERDPHARSFVVAYETSLRPGLEGAEVEVLKGAERLVRGNAPEDPRRKPPVQAVDDRAGGPSVTRSTGLPGSLDGPVPCCQSLAIRVIQGSPPSTQNATATAVVPTVSHDLTQTMCDPHAQSPEWRTGRTQPPDPP